MAGHGEKLSRMQEQAIAALLTEDTVQKAAEKAEVSYATLRNWLQDTDFLAEYRAARRQIVETAIARIQKVCWKAVAALERNLNCGKPAAEVAAAKQILAAALRGIELSDILVRLEAVLSKKEVDGDDRADSNES